jgi:gliding motility-associated-like protein
MYWVEVMANGCAATDTIAVDFYPADLVDFGTDTILCDGEFLVLDATLPGATYLWQDQSTNSTFTVNSPGAYWVTVLAAGCNDADTIVVDYKSLPTVSLGPDTLVCKGLPFVLDATYPGATYLWQDGSTSATFAANDEGDYLVVVTLNGCSASDTVTISHKDCEVVLEMPNVFSPNNDGANDFFEPVSMLRVTRFTMSIYNRWGGLVYNYSGLEPSWDGKDKQNRALAAGVYFYIISYEDLFGASYQAQGEVTLFR